MRLHSLLAFLLALPAFAQFPDGYVDEEVVSLSHPVAFAHDGNGQLYVALRDGRVFVVQDGAPILPPLLNIRHEVGQWGDFGLLGLVLDPDFLSNGYFYVAYIVDRHHLLHAGTPEYDTQANQYFSATIGRVTRFTADASTGFTTRVPYDRHVLLGESADSGVPILHRSHSLGGLAFGSDGTLLVSTGDGASFLGVDTGSMVGTYWSQALEDGIIRAAENVGAFRSQLVDSHSGKLLRIDRETGDGVSSNPFYDPEHPRSARSRVWALGLRNPFRISVRPGTGHTDPALGDPGAVFVGDVGWDGWEELNVVDGPGVNLGWPLFEGLDAHAAYTNAAPANLDAPNPLFDGVACTQEFFDFEDLLEQEREDHAPSFENPCDGALQIAPSTPTFMHRRARLEWRHGANEANVPVFEDGLAAKSRLGTPGCPVHGASFRGNCSIGGVWLSGLAFGEPFSGAYFLADYGEGWLRALEFEGNALHAVHAFGSVPAPTYLGEDPDGSLMYTLFDEGSVRRVRFTGDGNVAPQPVASHARESTIGAGKAVRLDATSSQDPEGGQLAFLWEFEDGSRSTAPSPLVLFDNPEGQPAHEEVELTVTDASGASAHAHVHVPLDNTPPTVTMIGATNGARFSVDEDTPLVLEALATDAEHGAAELSYVWEVNLHHANHVHPVEEVTGPSAAIALSPTPCDEEFYAYRVVVTVSDPEGLAATDMLWFFPDCPVAGSAAVAAPAAVDPGDEIALEVATSGTVTRVDLRVDGSLLGSIFAPPYTFPWTPSEPGTAMITALAHVEGEGVATSLGTPVVVRAPKTRSHDVASIEDDAQETLLDGNVQYKREVLHLGTVNNQPTLAGIRIPLDVPQGAKIVSAHLQLTASAVDEGFARLRIRAEAADDAAPIAPDAGPLSSRSTTHTVVTWQAQPWHYAGARGWRERTPDLAELLQEVVDRSAWQAGGHVLLLIDGFGRRRAHAFAPRGTEAPRLVVEFAE